MISCHSWIAVFVGEFLKKNLGQCLWLALQWVSVERGFRPWGHFVVISFGVTEWAAESLWLGSKQVARGKEIQKPSRRACQEDMWSKLLDSLRKPCTSLPAQEQWHLKFKLLGFTDSNFFLGSNHGHKQNWFPEPQGPLSKLIMSCICLQ